MFISTKKYTLHDESLVNSALSLSRDLLLLRELLALDNFKLYATEGVYCDRVVKNGYHFNNSR